jgi:hypothetical protein
MVVGCIRETVRYNVWRSRSLITEYYFAIVDLPQDVPVQPVPLKVSIPFAHRL